MRQNILLTCDALTAVCIITAFLLTVSDLSASQPPSEAPGQETSEQMSDVPLSQTIGESDSKSISPQYYLREYDGKIAVFLPDKNVPETVFEVYTSTLPSYDRGQLQLGIPIQSYEELVKRIEDYIS